MSLFQIIFNTILILCIFATGLNTYRFYKQCRKEESKVEITICVIMLLIFIVFNFTLE